MEGYIKSSRSYIKLKPWLFFNKRKSDMKNIRQAAHWTNRVEARKIRIGFLTVNTTLIYARV